ncbi:hypothetical protein IFR05_015567 [Cadophora sp. M221]|nr:hypothetical protein IFR05_015567 [Cadophora sp. M221]
MDWVGTVVSLWDTAIRVAAFANDLRAAQDDFIGLRAEAECLLICINSLNAPSCLDTLYRFINAKQAADLKSIVKSTELNMIELNQFLAKCKRVVGGKNATRRRKGVSKRVKERLAKAWATYRFTMTDKQAFRDKLILPAQSINIYLTMLTHVGLVNVKLLMQLSGDGAGVEAGVGAGVGGGVGAGVGAGVGGGGGWSNQDDEGGGGGRGGVVVNVGPVDRWGAVGRRVAFKGSIVDESELTTDIEEEIVRYALHLTRGGTPFQRSSGNDNSNSGWGRPRITTGPKRRTRSRSRSVGAFGVERDRKGQMYLVRKRSVGNLYQSGSESDGQAGRRRLLALPAPE